MFIRSIYKHFLIKEKNLLEHYTVPNSLSKDKQNWVIITGASGGQGRQFALQLASRGLNLYLIGSKNIMKVVKQINDTYPNINVKYTLVNFKDSYKSNFFNPIEKIIKDLDVCLLINNVGHRVGWNPTHETPNESIDNTIMCGTIVQTKLTNMVIPKLLEREKQGKRGGIIFITAQCIHSNYGFAISLDNAITLPYLGIYEAANAFGYYHAKAIHAEYYDKIDVLNITPGAVITENTNYLSCLPIWLPVSIHADKYVSNIIKFIGNITGTTTGYWGHEFSLFILTIFPFIKTSILEKVGILISNEYMHEYKKIG